MTSKTDRLFGSKTRVALLSEFMMNPDRTFYIRELSLILGIPYGMLYRELRNLISLGILSEERKGKITLVSVNKRLPYFNDLRGLIAKTSGLGDIVRSTLSDLTGVRYALIYGSVAAGEATEGSDVDLLVVGRVNEEGVLTAVSRAEKVLGREINYVLWSEREFAERVRSKHHLLGSIVSSPIIMLVGDEDEFRRTVKKWDRQEGKARS